MKRWIIACAALLMILGACGGDSNNDKEADVNPPGAPELKGDVEKTDSGLQYIDEKVGGGEQPRTGQQVSVHYTGWLTDGKQFDSSRTRGEPFAFPLGQKQVIKGWDEGVATMKVGGKRRLIIPAALGYGDRGSGSTIPPGATLVFDVELLSVR